MAISEVVAASVSSERIQAPFVGARLALLKIIRNSDRAVG
jgi:hypothetical protein